LATSVARFWLYPVGHGLHDALDESAHGSVALFGRLSHGEDLDAEVVAEDAEALVIAPKEDGLLGKLGFVSAAFEDWSTVPREVGMEVAQVDWDGVTTRADWALVQEVNIEDGVPRLVLDDGVAQGLPAAAS
jgi:hypothetical protein